MAHRAISLLSLRCRLASRLTETRPAIIVRARRYTRWRPPQPAPTFAGRGAVGTRGIKYNWFRRCIIVVSYNGALPLHLMFFVQV